MEPRAHPLQDSKKAGRKVNRMKGTWSGFRGGGVAKVDHKGLDPAGDEGFMEVKNCPQATAKRKMVWWEVKTHFIRP